MDLLEYARKTDPKLTPLAERMRPRAVEDFVGIAQLIRLHPILGIILNGGPLTSLIFWGPPGSGKTTLAELIAKRPGIQFTHLSAVLSGVQELRQGLKRADDHRKTHGQPTLLFVDEIHRWNKSQQDALLPYVERGIVHLIGATTENPSFAVNSALLSRCHVIKLQPLDDARLIDIMTTAWRSTQTQPPPSGAFLKIIAEHAQGDARRALNVLEQIANKPIETQEELLSVLGETRVYFDKYGDEYYHVTSAFIKSMRASQSEAAMYWLMRMVEGGADVFFITRRMMIFASEDVGNADPQALQVAVNTDLALQRLGMPEGLYALAQCCQYLSDASKSRAAGDAWQKAQDAVRSSGALEVPLHLRNIVTSLDRKMSYGEASKLESRQSTDFLPEKLRRPKSE